MAALTAHPNGVSSFGFPVMGTAGFGVPYQPNGNVWWVNAGASGSGTSPEDAFGTIQGAVDRAISGDTIMVFSGTYDENVTVDDDYVSIIGAQSGGYARPDIVPTAGVALVVNGQGFYARHLRFASADSDTVQWHSNGGQAIDCVFDGAAGQASTETNLRLVPSATDDSFSASENKFIDCLFRGSTGSGVTFQHALAAGGGEGTSDNQFLGCTFVDNAVSDLISKVNTNGGGAGIYIKLLVNGCNFLTVGAAYKYINFSAGAAGDLTANSCLISNNWFADEALTGGAGNQIDLGGQSKAMFVGNYDCAGLVNGSTFNN